MGLFTNNWEASREASSLLIHYRQLVWEMARREIADRYIGQAFGAFWAIGHPLFMIAVYIFVFAVVFKNKIGGTVEMPLDYTTYILAGLIPWLAIQEAMNKSCITITANASLVKQIVFPIEILPAKSVLASLLPQLVSTTLLFVYIACTQAGFFMTYFLLPVVILFQILGMLGLGYILAAISVYFRDIKDFIQMFGIAGMYLMPVVYLPEMVPTVFKPLIYLNPFSYLIWCYQDVIYFGRIQHAFAWFILPSLSITIFLLGYRLFRKLKPSFGNVL